MKLVGKLKKKDLAALNSAYAKGYAKFAYLHNVFDTAPTKDTNQADALTPVSNNSDVDFENAEAGTCFAMRTKKSPKKPKQAIHSKENS